MRVLGLQVVFFCASILSDSLVSCQSNDTNATITGAPASTGNETTTLVEPTEVPTEIDDVGLLTTESEAPSDLVAIDEEDIATIVPSEAGTSMQTMTPDDAVANDTTTPTTTPTITSTIPTNDTTTVAPSVEETVIDVDDTADDGASDVNGTSGLDTLQQVPVGNVSVETDETTPSPTTLFPPPTPSATNVTDTETSSPTTSPSLASSTTNATDPTTSAPPASSATNDTDTSSPTTTAPPASSATNDTDTDTSSPTTSPPPAPPATTVTDSDTATAPPTAEDPTIDEGDENTTSVQTTTTTDSTTCAVTLSNSDANCAQLLKFTNVTCDCYNYCNGKLVACVKFGEQDSFSCSGELVAGCTTDQKVTSAATSSTNVASPLLWLATMVAPIVVQVISFSLV